MYDRNPIWRRFWRGDQKAASGWHTVKLDCARKAFGFDFINFKHAGWWRSRFRHRGDCYERAHSLC